MANRAEQHFDTLLQGFLLAGGAALFAWLLGPWFEVRIAKRLEQAHAKEEAKENEG